MSPEREIEEEDLRHRRAGCLVAFVLWAMIGIPVFLLNLIGECVPIGESASAACATQRQWIGWLSLFGAPLVAGLVGWIWYRLRRRG